MNGALTSSVQSSPLNFPYAFINSCVLHYYLPVENNQPLILVLNVIYT